MPQDTNPIEFTAKGHWGNPAGNQRYLITGTITSLPDTDKTAIIEVYCGEKKLASQTSNAPALGETRMIALSVNDALTSLSNGDPIQVVVKQGSARNFTDFTVSDHPNSKQTLDKDWREKGNISKRSKSGFTKE